MKEFVVANLGRIFGGDTLSGSRVLPRAAPASQRPHLPLHHPKAVGSVRNALFCLYFPREAASRRPSPGHAHKSDGELPGEASSWTPSVHKSDDSNSDLGFL